MVKNTKNAFFAVNWQTAWWAYRLCEIDALSINWSYLPTQGLKYWELAELKNWVFWVSHFGFFFSKFFFCFVPMKISQIFLGSKEVFTFDRSLLFRPNWRIPDSLRFPVFKADLLVSNMCQPWLNQSLTSGIIIQYILTFFTLLNFYLFQKSSFCCWL